MSGLIVDFPTRGRCLPAGSQKKLKSVKFSSTMEVQFFQRHDAKDASKLWYLEQDYKAMKAANKQAAMDVHRRLSSRRSRSSSDSISRNENEDDLDNEIIITGLERLLTPKIIKKSMVVRKLCWSAVLDEQDRQEGMGECDPEKLGRVSQRRSEWSRKRAHTIAVLTHKDTSTT